VYKNLKNIIFSLSLLIGGSSAIMSGDTDIASEVIWRGLNVNFNGGVHPAALPAAMPAAIAQQAVNRWRPQNPLSPAGDFARGIVRGMGAGVGLVVGWKCAKNSLPYLTAAAAPFLNKIYNNHKVIGVALTAAFFVPCFFAYPLVPACGGLVGYKGSKYVERKFKLVPQSHSITCTLGTALPLTAIAFKAVLQLNSFLQQ